MSHKAGFVNIIGKPNAGKSTLMNRLMEEKLSIISPKAQTTRHRILGILNHDDYQIVLSDTPGYLKPAYSLHKAMVDFVEGALKDADLLLYLIDGSDKETSVELEEKIKRSDLPLLVLLNKIDLLSPEEVQDWNTRLMETFPNAQIIPLSALHGFHVTELIPKLLEFLPEHPAFYDKDALTDKPERFFAAEILREKIFLQYQQEIPYCCEVAILQFKEEPTIIRVMAEIYVERDSQKGILIGHQGKALKKTATEARKSMEEFFGKKIFLETHIKVKADWRNDQRMLNLFGYNQS